MGWNLHTTKRKGKAYISLQKNRRVEKKIESDYIYLGPEGDATKILFDLGTKPLIDEKEILEIYKSRGIVEEGFRALKSDLEIDPVFLWNAEGDH